MDLGAKPWTFSYAFKLASAVIWWLWKVRPVISMPNATHRSLFWNMACWRERIKVYKTWSKEVS